MRNKKDIRYFGDMTLSRCLDKNYEEFKSTGVLNLDIIQESFNKDLLLEADIDFTKDEDFEFMQKMVKDSKYTLVDFELTREGLKHKKYKPFTVEFNTSGKIIVENDLREYFDDHEDFNVNSTQGIIQTMDFYHKQGMLHGFVGNSCPTLYYSKVHGKILIGCDYDYDNDEAKLPDETYEPLTSVCTDLWWYSIVDVDKFLELNPNEDINDFEVVEIPSGTWILEHKYGISEKGYHENLPYATLTLKK